MRKQALLAIGSLVLNIISIGCVATNHVVRVDPDHKLDKKDGVFYALPRTVIALSVQVKKIVLKKGVYERFAACFFPDDERAERIVHRDCKGFEVGDPAISTRGEPDPSEIYMAKIQGNYFEDKNLTLALSEGGVPTKITEETTNHAVEILIQTAQTVTSLILRSATPAPDKTGDKEEADLDEVIRSLDPSVAACRDVKQQLEKLLDALRAMMQARNDLNQAISSRNQAQVNSKKQALADRTADFDKLNKNGEVLDAVNLYRRIVALQADREAMLLKIPAGQATGEAVRTALDEIDKLISALKSKFIGTKSTEKIWIASFELTPADLGFGASRNFQLFKLSPSSGVFGTPPLDSSVRFTSLNVPADFQSGDTIPSDCTGAFPTLQTVSIALNRNGDQVYTRIRDSFESRSESGDRGFYYRIPAVVSANVKLDSKNLFQAELRIAQLGLVASLPSSTGGRRTKYELEFYETGAMKNFVLGSDSLIQSSTIKDLGEAAGNVIDTTKETEKQAKAKKEEAAKASDETAKAKALSELLESCKKIRDSLVALGREPILPAVCNQ